MSRRNLVFLYFCFCLLGLSRRRLICFIFHSFFLYFFESNRVNCITLQSLKFNFNGLCVYSFHQFFKKAARATKINHIYAHFVYLLINGSKCLRSFDYCYLQSAGMNFNLQFELIFPLVFASHLASLEWYHIVDDLFTYRDWSVLVAIEESTFCEFFAYHCYYIIATFTKQSFIIS